MGAFQAALRPASAELLGTPIVGALGCSEPPRQPFAAHLIEQLQGDRALGLGLAEGLRHARLVQPSLVVDPAVGQEQPHRQRVMAQGTDVVDRRGDLAVGLLPQGAAILPLDTDGMLPCLREAGRRRTKSPSGL